MTLQRKATIVSSSLAALLTLIKLIVGVLSGSVAVLASAIDSVLDMFVSIFNYFAILNSEKPADRKFNYGRGKVEALALVIEGTIISISGLFIMYQAIKKAILEESSKHLDISIVVMFISLIITLALIHISSYEIIDTIVGIIIALYIIYSASKLIKEGILILLDRALDEELLLKIEDIIKNHKRVNDFHLLKTREVSNTIFVEVHLVFDCIISLMEAHKVCDDIEENIKRIDESKLWIVNIHLDPYDDLSKT